MKRQITRDFPWVLLFTAIVMIIVAITAPPKSEQQKLREANAPTNNRLMLFPL